MIEVIYNKALLNKENRLLQSKIKANTFMAEIPNFYVEMKWEVNIPLFSFLCPNDVCKIWKYDNKIKMDYTFIEMKGLSTIRSPTSFIYDGDNKETYLIYWEKNKWFNQFEPLEEDEKQLIVDDLLDGVRLNSEIKLNNLQFTPATNWRGNPVYEKINGFKTQLFKVKVEGIVDIHDMNMTEYETFEKEKYINKSTEIKKVIHKLVSNEATKEKIAKNLKLKNEIVKEQLDLLGKNKNKKLKANVWVADNYPFKFESMINMINSLSSANEIIDKLKEFFKDPEFQKIIDKGGFPIKIQIPINFLIDVTITFDVYK